MSRVAIIAGRLAELMARSVLLRHQGRRRSPPRLLEGPATVSRVAVIGAGHSGLTARSALLRPRGRSSGKGRPR
jgi:hypothetical protein